MANITRTIRIRAGRRLMGQLLRLLFCTLNLTLFIAGIISRKPTYIITGTLLFTVMIVVTLGRRSITVTINAGGILFSLPFWQRHFAWNDIHSAGVYMIRNGEVIFRDPKAARAGERLIIFVSVHHRYRPRRFDRFNSRHSMHFRWNRDAWAAIAGHIPPHAYTAHH